MIDISNIPAPSKGTFLGQNLVFKPNGVNILNRQFLVSNDFCRFLSQQHHVLLKYFSHFLASGNLIQCPKLFFFER